MKRAILAALLITAVVPASAAEIEVKGQAVYLTGTIDPGDELRFAGSAALLPSGTKVVLKSDGGRLDASLSIGLLIRKHEFATHVDADCISSCALIWLAGEPRSMNANAKIGFQTEADDEGSTPGSGKRIQEGYLSGLGLSDQMVRFATSTPRSGIQYLTRNEAKRLHLQVQFH